jgi:abortive infection bacteriophage resistance protein
MEFKNTIRGDIDVKIPAWAVCEVWNLLYEIKETEQYNTEDIKELRKIFDTKIDSIQRSIEFQRKNYGISKFDVR